MRKFYYDQEDRQRALDDATYKASLKPRVSAAEAVSGAKSIQLPHIPSPKHEPRTQMKENTLSHDARSAQTQP